jgi:hypothetical protein
MEKIIFMSRHAPADALDPGLITRDSAGSWDRDLKYVRHYLMMNSPDDLDIEKHLERYARRIYEREEKYPTLPAYAEEIPRRIARGIPLLVDFMFRARVYEHK